MKFIHFTVFPLLIWMNRSSLNSEGATYEVANHILESTPTNTPISATYDYKAPNVQYAQNNQGIETAIKNFLNAGGDAEKLGSSFDTVVVKDLTNDGLQDILVGSIRFGRVSEGNY